MKQRFTLSLTFLICALFFSVASSFAQSGNNCANAIPITVNVNDCVYSTYSNQGLTNSGQVPIGASCQGFAGGDLWLSAVVPPSGEMTFNSQLDINNPNFGMDLLVAAYTGTCGALSIINCADDGSGFFPIMTVSGTPGSTIYFQIWERGNNSFGSFRVCINGTPNCTAPYVNFVKSCTGNNEYQVSVNITNMGTANSVSITANGDDVYTGITSNGNYVVGPYPLEFDYELAVIPANDETCTVTRDITSAGMGCEYVVTCGTDLEEDYCYKNNENSNFLYTSGSSNELTITFNSGLIQTGSTDRVIIRNGNNSSAPILYQGTNGGDLTGLTQTASSGSIFMQVQSDQGGSCQDASLGLGGGWNWTVSCETTTTMCDGATNIISATTFAESEISGNLGVQVYSGIPQCGEMADDNPDQFFTFTAVGSVQYIRVNASGDFDPIVQVFDACDGTSLACVNEAGPGNRELFWLTDLTIGQEYAYRVFHNGNGNSSTTSFETAVAHIPTVQLRDADCGSTGLVANSIIRSTTPNPNYLVDGFVWEFTELEAPFTVYEVNSPNGSNPQFRLYWFTDYEYGRSYSVRIKARMYQGPNLGEYGPACTISLSSGVTTALQPQYDNGFFQFCQTVKAVAVTGATNYRWEFDSGLEVLEYNSNSSNYFCPLQNVEGLQMATSYEVDVYVTHNGVESVTSTTRTINTNNAVNNTSLNPAFITCGSNINITQSAQAYNICAADYYTFRFTNVSQPLLPAIEYIRPNRVISFNWVPGLIPGDTYNVAVKAFVGGLLGDYSTECEITFNGLTGISGQGEGLEFTDENEGIAPAISIYPNPITDNQNQVLISVMDLNSSQQEIEVRVFDMSGRLMTSEKFGNNGTSFNAILNLENAMATGVYIVTTTVNGEPLKTEKLIVE